MSKNALKMSNEKGEAYSTIRRWIKKGYFGELEKGENGRYVIPDDMPLPYKTNGQVDRDTTLLKTFIDASDLGRTVHKDMFPKVDEFRFERMLNYAVDAHLVEKRSPYTGITQLLSTEEGRAIINATPEEQKEIIQMLLSGTEVAVALATFGIQYGPQIYNDVSILLNNIAKAI